MKLDNAKITIMVDQSRTTIELHDSKSSILIASIELTAEQFCRAIGRGAYTECVIEMNDSLHLLNKTMENKYFEFEIPDVGYKEEQRVAKEQVIKLCPEGWEPDLYFASQDSFFRKDEKSFARCTIRRWVNDEKLC